MCYETDEISTLGCIISKHNLNVNERVNSVLKGAVYEGEFVSKIDIKSHQ
jgi:hypothetical protein